MFLNAVDEKLSRVFNLGLFLSICKLNTLSAKTQPKQLSKQKERQKQIQTP
jgi:hypothetical protein